MVNELIEEVLQYHTLDSILAELELTEYEALQALLDAGVITTSDLNGIISYDPEEDEA
jgi:hypothetical protein